jgi:energy-coupling factor transporter ATP-binding protein EcfA2
MLGLTQREARRRTDAVIEFAELDDFVDLKLKNYSSGMLVRLAFSVMIQVDADILLIDEVLAVGDAAFQQKCYEEFARLRRDGRTVVLVTHDMGSVERFCDRTMLLEKGRVVDVGEPKPMSMRYLQLNFSQEARDAEAAHEVSDPATATQATHRHLGVRARQADELRAGDGDAEILSGWFHNTDGHEADVLDSGGIGTFNMHVRFHEDAQDPVFGFSLRNDAEKVVIAASSERCGLRASGGFRADEEVVVSFVFQNVLAPGRYGVSAVVAHAGSGMDWMDNRERFRTILVSATEPSGALVELPFQLHIQRDVVDVRAVTAASIASSLRELRGGDDA